MTLQLNPKRILKITMTILEKSSMGFAFLQENFVLIMNNRRQTI